VSIIIPRPRFLRVLNALQWSGLTWGSLVLGGAFATGALSAGILTKPAGDVPVPIVMSAEPVATADVVPTQPGRTATTRRGRARAPTTETGAKRDTVGIVAAEATPPPPEIATARAQDQPLSSESLAAAAIGRQVDGVARGTEQSASGSLAEDSGAASTAVKDVGRPKRTRRNHWRLVRHELDAYGSHWAYADRQMRLGREYGRREFGGPSHFWFGR